MGERPGRQPAALPEDLGAAGRDPRALPGVLLDPRGGKSIPVHEGPYRGYLRYHLGLVVPAEDPPSIRIKDQHYTWREGESILFDDSWEHEVINHCPEDRVVLIVDIRRPDALPLRRHQPVGQSIMRQVYGKEILKKLA